MRTTTIVATIATAFAANASAARSHYPPNPANVPHHMAFVSGARPLKAADDNSTAPQLSCVTHYVWPFRCAVTGTLQTPEDTSVVESYNTVDDCRDSCLANPQCSAFGYESSSGNCTILQNSLRVNGLVADANSDTTFWNYKCYSCEVVSSE